LYEKHLNKEQKQKMFISLTVFEAKQITPKNLYFAAFANLQQKCIYVYLQIHKIEVNT